VENTFLQSTVAARPAVRKQRNGHLSEPSAIPAIVPQFVQCPLPLRIGAAGKHGARVCCVPDGAQGFKLPLRKTKTALFKRRARHLVGWCGTRKHNALIDTPAWLCNLKQCNAEQAKLLPCRRRFRSYNLPVLDIRLIRNEPEFALQRLAACGVGDDARVDELLPAHHARIK